MNIQALRGGKNIVYGPLIGGAVFLAATALLLPNSGQIADAIRRGTFIAPAASPLPPDMTPARLMQHFAEGRKLQADQLRLLLLASAKTESAERLSAIADGLIKEGGSPPVEQVTYDVLASGRPDAALAFLDGRPEGTAPSLWPLRFDLHRKTGDHAGAAQLLQAAIMAPNLAPAKDIVNAIYALGQPEWLVVAAEHRAVPPLTRKQSLDLASWAHSKQRYDLIARIDRAGTPSWRDDNPWLAMTLAQREGNVAAALRYAALLPTGRESARESIIMGSGDRQAIRQYLLERAGKHRDDPVAAENLLRNGFRSDAIALLQQQSGKAPSAQRMLYLMGPRPHAKDMAWLRAKAASDPHWLAAYLEREQPGKALVFVEALPSANETDMLLRRIGLANAARDRAGAERALGRLLDGRRLTASQLAVAASANLPASQSSRYALALSRARLAADAATAADRLDLAWEAWNQGDAKGAQGQLEFYLKERPQDRTALRLMAEVQRKLHGDKAARPWLERALAASSGPSRDRAELLSKLGRVSEAIATVETLRRDRSGDRQLDILLARLLVASGNPGKAQRILRP